MNLERIITIVVGIGGIVAMMDSAMQRYTRSAKAKYAAERDFAHLQRNQEQMKQSIAVLMEENDEMKDEMIQMRTEVRTLIAWTKENQGER